MKTAVIMVRMFAGVNTCDVKDKKFVKHTIKKEILFLLQPVCRMHFLNKAVIIICLFYSIGSDTYHIDRLSIFYLFLFPASAVLKTSKVFYVVLKFLWHCDKKYTIIKNLKHRFGRKATPYNVFYSFRKTSYILSYKTCYISNTPI